MRYILYLRVSTDKQDVSSQNYQCINYVNQKKTSHDQVIIFEEEPMTTKLPIKKRIKLKEMLDFVEKEDELVVFKIDRLARNPHELVYLYTELTDQKKVNIHSISEPFLKGKDNNEIFLYAYFGAKERESISQRTKSQLQYKIDKKERVGSCRYGYTLDENKLQIDRQNVHSYKKPYLLVPDQKEVEQVKLMIQWKNEGLGYKDITDRLNRMGYKNRKGNPLHRSTVYRVLKRLEKEDQYLDELKYA